MMEIAVELNISTQEISVDLGSFAPTTNSEHKLQSKAVTSTTAPYRVLPDSGFYGFSEILVNEIPYSEVTNTAGGMTASIA